MPFVTAQRMAARSSSTDPLNMNDPIHILNDRPARNSGPRRLLLWTALATIAVTASGCSLAQLRQQEQAEADALLDRENEVFQAEFNAAFAAKDWKKAAAAFTPRRHELLIRSSAWGAKQDDLWQKVSEAANEAVAHRDFATAVELYESMEKARLSDEMRKDAASAKARYKAQLDIQIASWNTQLEPARADEAAGRPATAAMRLAALSGAPGSSLLSQAQASMCGLMAKAAQPYRTTVHVRAGKGDASLLASLITRVAAAPHGPAVVLQAKPEGVDAVITLALPEATLKKTARTETRQSKYISGQKSQPNPRIKTLQEKIARFEKDARWHEGKVASIRCGGSAQCSTIYHGNQARDLREKLAAAQEELGSEPTTKMGPVYSDVSYDVQVHRWELVQPVAFDVAWKDGTRETRSSSEITRWEEAIDQPDVPQLGLAAETAVTPNLEQMRKELRGNLFDSAEYMVHMNLDRRANVIVKAIAAASGIAKAELICSYFAAIPIADAENIEFADKELQALLGVSDGGTRMAQASKVCAAQSAKLTRPKQ